MVDERLARVSAFVGAFAATPSASGGEDLDEAERVPLLESRRPRGRRPRQPLYALHFDGRGRPRRGGAPRDALARLRFTVGPDAIGVAGAF